MFLVALVAWIALASGAALAVEPGERLDDPVLEARARDISKGLRCLVCQNQSIDDSNADLARDLRLLVRERLRAGDSDSAVLAYITDRYGDFVRLRPPLKSTTLLLWSGPAMALALGLLVLVGWYRRRSSRGIEEPPLSDDERRRLETLLDEREDP